MICRVPGYEFDVFISYSQRGSAQKWLKNHFLAKLEDCLADQGAQSPRVFWDRTMHKGVHWPSQLQKALHRSKIMIAVLTPLYFTSPWCMAELRSMYAREQLLGLADTARPQGLIYPILYSDSQNFPAEESLHRAWWDFKALATPEPVFQESRDWHSFHLLVSKFAEDVVDLLNEVPPWRADYPLIDPPDPLLQPPPKLPRF
ncbi:TIR domain-containing protein [Labedaea rhizosphaerae]|uniref:TIR domain-containing protein n=1 Tax=Labedaea rhizosphaerae TaxID=598644 RepID=A0A4R6S706_LABRH|nr:TIR domain-containing protein [Labedaea rhizosphaerae]